MLADLAQPIRTGSSARMRPIRSSLGLAFLGSGAITRTHSRTIERVNPSVRRYYASRDHARAIDLNREMGGEGGFESYDAALESPDVDAVMIATPPSSHLDLTLAALD